MTVAIIALFMSVAVCALIGWAFIRILGVSARRFQRRPEPPAQRANDLSIVFRLATPDELAERDRIRGVTPPKGHVETYFEKGRWKNKVQGNSRASNVHERKAAAVSAGREMARKRKVDHLIKDDAGTVVQDATSDGNDPQPVQG